MEQKIPNIKDAVIKRIVEREFSSVKFTKIEGILKRYQSRNSKGMNRIYAAILKLSNGNIELIKKYVEQANSDYRDIIALAEYPNYSKYDFDENLSKEKEKQLIDSDWKQYEIWLNS
ncbi:hypothetical protein N9Q58_04315 [Polaribacter sp.]|nr:hypothetical protein [Polaribacter sp.]